MSKNIIIYVDMDNTIFDYNKSHNQYIEKFPHVSFPQSFPGFFKDLEPLPGAVETVNYLRDNFDVYILTAPSYYNPHSYTEKRISIEKHFGFDFTKNLIISRYKHLNKGDYLIDDNITGCGQDLFDGKHLHFGSEEFSDWTKIKEYFKNLNNDNQLKLVF